MQLSIFEFEYFLSLVVGKTLMRTTLKSAQFASQNLGKIILPGKAWLTTCLLTRWKSKSWSCRALASCTSRAENALFKKKERQIIKGFFSNFSYAEANNANASEGFVQQQLWYQNQ